MKLKLLLALILSAVGIVANAQPQFTAKLLAGSGLAGYIDGNGDQARFSSIAAMCTDSKGNVYVWDVWNGGKIRRIGLDGYVSTIADFKGEVRGVASDQTDNIWILTDRSIDRLRSDGIYEKIADGVGQPSLCPNQGRCISCHGVVTITQRMTTNCSNLRSIEKWSGLPVPAIRAMWTVWAS